jgi:hypothetical protein
MTYDLDVTSSLLNIDVKNKIWRVDFQRPPLDGAGSLFANCFLKQDQIDATPGSMTSGSVLMSKNWIITIDRTQILSVPNAGTFLNGIINIVNNLKSEYDSIGYLETGSISQIS